MKKTIKLLWLTSVVLGLASCNAYDNPVAVTDDKPFPCDDAMDYSVRPGDDFYRYVNGLWLDSPNPSPSVFKQVEDELNSVRNRMVSTSNDPLIVMLRTQADATLSNDSKNVELVNARLQQLENAKTADQMYECFAMLHQLGYSPILRLLPCPSEGSTVVMTLNTGSMTDEMIKAVKYKKADDVQRLVTSYCQLLSGFGFSQERIAQITQRAISVELSLMDAYSTGTEMFHYPVVSHRAATKEDHEDRGWYILNAIGVTKEDMATRRYIIFNDKALPLVSTFAAAEASQDSVEMYRDYMIYNIIAQDADFVPSINKDASRNAMLVNALRYNNYYMYRQLTEYYGYDNIHKQECTDMMEKMRKIFIDRVNNLDWMGEATKAEARKKAQAMKFYIGYPEQWNDAMTPAVNGNNLMENVTQLRQQARDLVHKLVGSKTYDITWDIWATYAHFTTDNACYVPSSNALVILPSWLTMPRFDINISEAFLYAVAVTFAHEFCHGFDASGSLFDETGDARNWWEPADMTAFQAKQEELVELFNQLEAYPGQLANGRKTLVENMADYGGIELALASYKQRLSEQGFKGAQLDEQIKKFFVAYGYSWRHEREFDLDILKRLYEIDPHSAPHNRINGMMRLLDDWYRLYDVKPTDKLYVAPQNRVKIW